MRDRASGTQRATVLGAFLEGWRRMLRAPAVGTGALVAAVLISFPSAIALWSLQPADLFSALAAQAQGVSRTFTYELFGPGRAMPSMMGWFLDSAPLTPALAGAVAAYVAASLFLSGGILDRFARARPVRAAAFFSACGVHFLQFIRLAALVGVAYWAVFRWLYPLLFDRVYSRWTEGMTDARAGIAVRVVLFGVFLLALMTVNLVADFAKVRAVVEDRRSMIGSVAAAIRFLRRRPLRIAALYLLNVLAALVVLRVWFQVAPSVSAPTWVAWLVTLAYLLCRLGAKLAFMASEVVFFQGELAHATYTAAPLPVWPESPAVEAMDNLFGAGPSGPINM